MNGRMYDPLVGRFLSPDPYVQVPDFSQSFNRYSYCLNNPLIYTDPDGELIWIIPNIGWSKSGGLSIGVSVVVGLPGVLSAQAGVGYSFGNNDFNVYAGASAGLMTAYTSYSTQSGWNAGYSVGLSPFSGLPISTNFLTTGYNYNITNDYSSMNFSAWTFGQDGSTTFNPSFSVAYPIGLQRFKLTEEQAAAGAVPEGRRTVTGRYAGQIEDVNVYETKLFGTYGKGDYYGLTVPERGILVGRGVYKNDWDMIRHEFGHVLQYRLWGSDVYWKEVGPTSFKSAKNYSSREHMNTWTEWSANYLSYHHLGQPSNWNLGYYVIWPTSIRYGVLPPFVRGPIDFKFNWLDIKR